MSVSVKKVAMISHKWFGTDGISTFIMNSYRCFNHKQFHCNLIYSRFYGDVEIAKKMLSEFSENGDLAFCIPRSRGMIKYFFYLVRHLKEQKYDIVHIHGSSASIVLQVFAAKIAGVKMICTHSHNTCGNHVWIHKILRFLLNRMAITPLACGRKAGLWMYGKKRQFQIVPNGIDLSVYKFRNDIRMCVREKLNIAGNQILIGHVGGLNALAKNHNFLIDFTSLVKKKNLNVRMLFVGSGCGVRLKKLQDYVNSLNVADYIYFLGQRTDVNELMMGMDAFFLPSLFEGFPIVSVEAQASGLPVFISETISKEVEITDLVHWLPIDKGPECWLQALEKCSFSRNRSLYADEVKKRGFDVQTSSVLLQKIYLDDTDEIDR